MPGYGAAVHAGLLAATRDYVAFMDGDGSFDPADLLPLLDDVRSGRADLAVGRRRPVAPRRLALARPRSATRLVVWLAAPPDRAPGPRHRADPGLPSRPTCWRWTSRDRRFGYPVELLQKATRAGWRIVEHDVAYHPRAAGTRSKVSGSVRGHAPDRARLLAGAA